ncbi:hypothetical protein LPB19_14145 [Marinobacter salinisoli]|uniref:Uncharacterized protein n=1 Tax=Marinobacter salinisoli TaxID=2769486 RepID=A0ABX7MVN3_9GAMM|nr:hypothetical protein [Marinobacter salinisoli]QSP94308.1 hypothetical protein LPB19_14145 [Marinobacter salinisoli]
MKPTHYFAILVRLFAIVLAIYAVRQSAFLIEMLRDGDVQGYELSFTFTLVSTLCPLIASALLWFFPMTVSRIVIRPELDQAFEPIGVKDLLTVLVLAIGVYVFYLTVSDAVYWITLWQMSQDSYSDAALYLGNDSKAAMLTTVIELFISLGLLLRARTISDLILKLTR